MQCYNKSRRRCKQNEIKNMILFCLDDKKISVKLSDMHKNPFVL